ncbi:MAG: ATP-binding protein [Polymorphobacter sp.]
MIPSLSWNGRFSLVPRILAVNVFALLVLAGGIVYLDSFRERLIDQRRTEVQMQAQLVASFLAEVDSSRLPELAARYGQMNHGRLKVYASDGRLVADSWTSNPPSFVLRDPAADPFRRDIARFLDRVIERIGSSKQLPRYIAPATDTRAAWPEVAAAARGTSTDALRRAPDRIVIISSAAPIRRSMAAAPYAAVQLTVDTRDITDGVREERLTSFLIFLGVLAISLLLSSFLASTIVRPLRRLAVAAQRVRLGRSRDVTVPRFATRRDEIGQLARALSDMTLALRDRIDATEAFAADVAHELKNPLASLRSAVDTFEVVDDPALKAQLLEVVRDDVGRIDRLITDIADASRLDAELSRSRFERLDLGALVMTLVRMHEAAGNPRRVTIAAKIVGRGHWIQGEPARLAQVVRNLIDNAVSFSPDDDVVTVSVEHGAGACERLIVDDNGPGVPPDNQEDIFRRFYSERPEREDFGRHSGLGLAIARTIAEAHDGSINVENRVAGDRIAGARFTVSIPSA